MQTEDARAKRIREMMDAAERNVRTDGDPNDTITVETVDKMLMPKVRGNDVIVRAQRKWTW